MKLPITAPRLVLGALLLLGLSACGGGGGDDDAPAPAPTSTVTLTAAPTSLTLGSPTTLTWSSTNATACAASGAWTGTRATSGNERPTPTAVGTASYTLTCTGPGGSANATASVTVIAPPPPSPTVTLTAAPETVVLGSPTTLTWSSTNATACTATGDWTGSRGISGTESQTPATAGSATYILTCTGAGGSGDARAIVTVNRPPAPTVTISANPASIVLGSSTTLTWSTTNATACTASEGWTGSRGTSGTEAQTPTVTGNANYALTCTGLGGSASARATVSVTPPTVRLTLRGRVIDTVIPNAAITVSVGSQTFTGISDTDGNYAIPLDVLTTNLNGFVSIVAVGSGTQPTVRFASLLGSFAALQAVAGSDTAVVSNENFRVNVTNVSTAEAALATEANGGATPTTDATLATALMAVDPEQVIDIATVIKLVVDGGVALPAGATNTSQLARSANLRNPFIEDQRTNNSAAFVAARTSILADPNLTMGATTATVPRVAYTFVSAASTEENLLGLSVDRDAHSFSFNADGGGRYADSAVSSDTLRWSVAPDGSIAVRFTTNPEVTYVTQGSIPEEPGFGDITCRYEVTAIDIRPISSTSAAQRVRATRNCTTLPELNNFSFDETHVLAFVSQTQLSAFNNDDFAEKTYALKILTVSERSFVNARELSDDFVTFYRNGTGITRLLNLTFTWSVQTDGSLQIVYSNGITGRYSLIRPLFGTASLFVQEFQTATNKYIFDEPAYVSDASLTFTADNVPGVYYQFGVGNEAGVGIDSTSNIPLTPAEERLLKGFTLEFFAGRGVAQLGDSIGRDENGNAFREVFPSVPQARRIWGFRADGIFTSVRYQRGAQGQDLGCTFYSTDPNCILEDVRELFPIAAYGNRRVILERRTFLVGPENNFQAVRYYDYAPPGDWELPRNDIGSTTTTFGPGKVNAVKSRNAKTAKASPAHDIQRRNAMR